MLALGRSGDRILVTVRVGPRAASNLVAGERDGALLVRVLAKALDVPPSEVRLVRGAAARVKVLSLPASVEVALRRFGEG